MQDLFMESHGQSALSYIVWFYMISHLILVAPIEGDPPMPANMEVLIEEENANYTLDALQIIRRVRIICFDRMKMGIAYDDMWGSLQ